ncbi:hypothetical protein IW146_009176 [Coemansia sp. RSA 922]|nr:hypothetical protein GGI14_005196 [Coemansia sp. S680]KAJ2070772.1 hypothetical protein GGH13_003801 [Coemansia sp. S155-1]KAJ2072474.1 hypothetical protein GGI16_008997 [Coemansia sp. S142-1]KAJ2083528.1 hypothetical protein GGI09_007369 [Coemansia sp. S100]KAJ2102126.1 hypothetical protein IW146_009176 [Coemansia sp. RSA 922]
MVKLFTALIASAALLQGALGHMQVISPSPRSGIVADEIYKPCGGGNTLTTNVTTYDVNSKPVFVLRPGHGSGNLIFNYFTELTITNDTKSFPLADIPIPKAGTYNTTLDFAKAGLKNGQSIVVQAIYNGTDAGKTEAYYVCFDVKLAGLSSGTSTGASSTATSGTNSAPTSASSSGSSKPESETSKSAASSVQAVLGAILGLAVAAAIL